MSAFTSPTTRRRKATPIQEITPDNRLDICSGRSSMSVRDAHPGVLAKLTEEDRLRDDRLAECSQGRRWPERPGLWTTLAMG